MASFPPMRARYAGDGEFHLLGRSKQEADARFVAGEIYALEELQQRSSASHAHYFAALTECWRNLPENEADRFPKPENLRKWALIRTGFATQRQIVASSRAEALRLAAFIAPMDEYAIVETRGSVVTVFEAESQSMRSMGKKRFEESKDAVLGYCANLIGVTAEQLPNEQTA